MTIEELRKRKKELEIAVGELLITFEKETTLPINNILITREIFDSGQSVLLFVNTEIKI